MILGHRSAWWTSAYEIPIGLGFLASPALQAMAVGFLALQKPTMMVTIVIAHIAYGLILGFLLRRWLPQGTSISRASTPALALL